MKLVDYECTQCKHVWEDWQQKSLPICPVCCDAAVREKFPTPMIGGETPYKTLEKSKGIPDPKKIYSGPYSHSKTR